MGEKEAETDIDGETCQCCWTLCHMATLPVLLMVTSCIPVKNRPSTGIFISNDAAQRQRSGRG
jgi:hypothetical protein